MASQSSISVTPFSWAPDDPLAPEHACVAELVKQSFKDGRLNYSELDLDFTEAGKTIRDASAKAGARFVLALVAHAAHFDGLGQQARGRLETEMERLNWHHSCPEWKIIWPSRQISAQAVRRIMRKKLPLEAEHLTRLADWIADADWIHDMFYPLKSFIRALENFGSVSEQETSLRAALERVTKAMRNGNANDLPKFARTIDLLLKPASVAEATETVVVAPAGPDPSVPAPVGSSNVLVRLKQYLRIVPESEAAEEIIGYDRFPLRADSLLRAEHEMISRFLPDVVETTAYHDPDLTKTEAGKTMLQQDAVTRGRLVLAAAERCVIAQLGARDLENHQVWQSRYAVSGVFRKLLYSNPSFDRNGMFDVLLYVSALDAHRFVEFATESETLIQQAEQGVKEASLTQGERHVIHRLRCRMVRACPFGVPDKEVQRLDKILGDRAFFVLTPGEGWTDTVNRDLGQLPKTTRDQWMELFSHAAKATSSRPTEKWLKQAKALCAAIGMDVFRNSVQRWFSLINAPRTIKVLPGSWDSRSEAEGVIGDDTGTCLRGLVWMASFAATPDLIRALGMLTASCYRKLPGIGARAPKVGNAGVYALSQITDPAAVGQLALLKVKVKLATAQKEIEKAFTAAAERSGLSRDEIEEMSVPSYGLTDVGVCEETLGEYTARLTVTGTTTTELEWIKNDGKKQKSVPASVKADHKEDLKELQAAAKDIQNMLPAQRERIDGLFLQQKTWSFATWQERYLNHPLIGTLARRMLWEFRTGECVVTGIWFNGAVVDVDLKPIVLAVDTTVQLWHPIGKSTEEIIAWRGWLDAQQIQQPFKQAHREIYVLTAAEENTRIYSNRYAAHVVRQHQFNALCALRGWKNQLRLMVDSDYLPPTLQLPQWGLRAEYWVASIGQDFGSDTNENGVYLRLATDQVRFYRLAAAQRTTHALGGGYQPGLRAPDAEPVPLSEIPPLVFSEVMRDVDLFVGVASVGNDPTWNDGGPQGRYREYWHNYSFGELNASARTRQEVLERLLPRLKIAKLCSFDDKFLVVRGQLRTYKIHLGSGNILMEPNNQYLCIVPKPGDQKEDVILPFEGDRTLSVILSKAFMLADDQKIKDESITRQIKLK